MVYILVICNVAYSEFHCLYICITYVVYCEIGECVLFLVLFNTFVNSVYVTKS